MTTFTEPGFWLQALLLLPVLFISWYIPGNILLRKIPSLTPFQSVVLSSIVGLVLWALQGMLFGYMGMRWLTYLYLITFLLWWIRIYFHKRSFPHIPHPDLLLLLISIVGIVIQLITVWFIGYQTREGLAFCCFWPDSFYHLALIGELTKNFPPVEPGMHGVYVRNYHYLANLVVAELVRIFHFSPVLLQYQLLPLLITGLVAGITITIGSQLSKNKLFSRLFLFFMLFGGDIIFLLLFLLGKGLSFELTVSENATTLWFSPPRVYGMIIVLGGMSLLLHWIKNPSVLLGIVIGLVFGSLVGFKIYIGFFALFGLFAVCCYYLLRKDTRGILPVAVAGILTLALYLPINTGAGGLFYSGLWRIDDFAVRPALGLISFTLAKQVYMEHHNYLRVFIVESLFFVLYLFCLFGVGLLGFIQTKRSLKEFPLPFHIFLISGGIVCFVIGMFFLQSTGGANTLQFLFTMYILGAFYTALAVSYWYHKINKSVAFVVLVILLVLSSTRVIHETSANIRDLRNQEGYFTLSPKDQEGLTYLRQTIPDSAVVMLESERATSDECYVYSFVANRNFYLCGSGILEDHGLAIEKRKSVVEAISKEQDVQKIMRLLLSEKIDYLYVPSGYVFGTTQIHDVLLSVYNNGTMQLFVVNKEALHKMINE